MDKKLRVLVIAMKVSLFIMAVVFCVLYFMPNVEFDKLGGVIGALTLIFVLDVIKRLLKADVSAGLELLYLLFLFMALFLGINMDLYKTVPFYDKVMHFISGVLTVILARYAMAHFRIKSNGKVFDAVFIVCFAMAVAVVWEFFEYASDKFLGTNMQQLISVGVDDTMQDLLAATLGAICALWVPQFIKPPEKDKSKKRR
jgi:uncharacterized membrane protein YjdF